MLTNIRKEGMKLSKQSSGMTQKCHECHKIIPIYKYTEHYAICHILWKNPVYVPKYFYDDGSDVVEYSEKNNNIINKALVNKKTEVIVNVGKSIHKINFDKFDIKIKYTKPFWCCSFVNFACLVATFNNKYYDYNKISHLYDKVNNNFPFYRIYMGFVSDKIPIYFKQ